MLLSREKDDDDEFFPNPNYKSNLASIFGARTDDGNSSLTYTPPKQPKAQNKAVPSTATPKSSTVIAKTVQTFKMVDNSYQSQGKLGAAITKTNIEKTMYQLLLYSGKRTQVCTARISRDFRFLIQTKNYATFYDSHNVIWSIHFDSATDLVEFTLQVALARWKAGDSTTPLMVQDLWCPVTFPSDHSVSEGDNVEFTYNLSTVDIATEVPVVEKRGNVRVDAEESGWERALLGASPTSKKVIIIQPALLVDLISKEVNESHPVMMTITVDNISKGDSLDTAASELEPSSPKIQPATGTSDGLTDTSKITKADLISRMARMGQALPFKTITSDSDDTEEDRSRRFRNTVSKPRTRQHIPAVPVESPPHSASIVPTQMVGAVGPVIGATSNLPSPVTVMSHQMTMAQPYMMSGMYPAAQVDNQAQFNMFFSEVRTTNSELRMGITRLTDKVDALQSKFDSPVNNEPNNEMMYMMERLLQHEQHVKDQLQLVISSFQNHHPASVNGVSSAASAGIADHHSSPPAQSSSVTSAVEPCAQHRETQASLTERVKKLEEENEYLQTTTNAQKEALQNARLADQDRFLHIEDLQRKLNEERSKVSELTERLENFQAEKDDLIKLLENKTKTLSELQERVLEKQLCIDKLEQAVQESEATQLDEVKRNMNELMPKLIVEEHAKKIMNAVYRLIKVQFKPQTNYEAGFILSVLADTIKAVLAEYLESGDLTFSNWQQTFQEGDRSKILPSKTSQEGTCENQIGMNEGHYVRKEQRIPSSLEGKLSLTVNPEVRSEPELPSHQETIPSGSQQEVSVITNSIEQSRPEDSLTSVSLVEESEGRKHHPSPANVPSNSDSLDIRRPQPPPPPLFDDEENDDAWLNS